MIRRKTMTATTSLPSASPPGLISALWGKLHRLAGFQKGYNFLLWSIFGIGALAFALSRISYLDYFGVFCRKNFLSLGNHAAPGECYYFLNGGRQQIGMMLHLYSIIPCSILVFFQFIPILRHKLVLFHRINGYVVVLLMGVALVSGLMALSESFGGDPAWLAAVTVHSIMVTAGLTMGVLNIRKLQIEQHRAWMLRTWIWVKQSPCSSSMKIRIVFTDSPVFNRPSASSACASSNKLVFGFSATRAILL